VQVLDGRDLAARRAEGLAARAAEVRARRGRAPVLLLVAFADAAGRASHVAGKLRACAAAGVETVPLIVAATHDTDAAVAAMHEALDAHRPDGVFVQFPYPAHIAGERIEAAIPEDADVDIMTTERIRRYLDGAADLPPVTVTAALLLLDDAGVAVEGRSGAVVAEESPFSLLLCEALRRRGATMQPLIAPASPDLPARVRNAGLVVVAAGQPGLVSVDMLRPGSIAVDLGYFNEGGRGDIDTRAGCAHLAAIIPVPGGIGPMTVSALVERVIAFAEC
jgi:methylenetetrahydrofolate dehydrogenase (NADP+) / methenyltetrahydrofolate cyclohydrolase